jgi:RimJ/RimL family protein N-acetyltransferase
VRFGYRSWAFGEVDNLPGSSQVAVFHSAFVKPELQNKGYGSLAHEDRLLTAKHELGYDYALCTVDVSNAKQIKILVGFGWKELDTFKSSKTGHTVALYGRGL